MSVDEKFQAAVDGVKLLTKRPTDQEFLELYGLYKQATEGNVNTPRPGMLELKAKLKWDSWKSKEDMSQNDAKEAYVKLVETLTAKYK
ncbi:acyl-CoA-binding protein homolog [Colletes latitarsis]|uniref:acyl-CoA-binding protein homolog n=1 Tax=Colletes latitarsis TaxID=2605962 RepID=UPI004035458E